MAIFTSVANYLKCRNYFESVLGFKLIEKYPDESQSDFEDDTEGFGLNSDGSGTPDIDRFGIFCRKSNRIVAHNIWFLYGKALPWGTGDDDPPRETEDGFVIKDSNGNITTSNNGDKISGFVLDPAGSTSSFEFIGMKRLLPLDDIIPNNYGIVDLHNPDKVGAYKEFVKFIKLLDNLSPENLTNYDQDIKPINNGTKGLNEKQPNSLLLKTAYDYNDFGFDSSNKEYNVRQIGMLTNLHVLSSIQSIVAKNQTLYNGLSVDNDTTINLCDLFNITEASLDIPSSLFLGDRFTSVVGGTYAYDDADEYLRNELDLGNGEGGVRTNLAVTSDNTFFGILQFYLNSMPNNRITFQTDTYNFILSFENQIKCSCTCSNCECPKV